VLANAGNGSEAEGAPFIAVVPPKGVSVAGVAKPRPHQFGVGSMARGLLSLLVLLAATTPPASAAAAAATHAAAVTAPAAPAGLGGGSGVGHLRRGWHPRHPLHHAPRMLNALPPSPLVASSSSDSAAKPERLARTGLTARRLQRRLRPKPLVPAGKASSPPSASATPAEAAVAPRAKLSPTTITSDGQAVRIRPQVFFLFMVYTKISNVEIWDRFFEPAQRGVDYTALVHCKSEADCRKIISPNRFLVIPSVETSYCLNLVGGMNALLKTALTLSGVGSPNDKFVFVSDSTLPVKPFSYVYNQLTGDSSSDFCVFPRNEWAEVTDNDSRGERKTVRVAPKVHQWLALGRRHAELSVNRSKEDLDLMRQLQLNMGQGISGFRNTGCLDEFWHFAQVYKGVTFPLGATAISLPDFNGGPLDTANYEIQGRCNTFVHWVQRASGVANNITSVAQAMIVDAGTDMVPASDVRPASIRGFGRASLSSLRKSSFLFVRKVEEKASFSGCSSLPEAFSDIVFSQDPRPVTDDEKAWAGQGMWLDNLGSPVRIQSAEGAIRLKGDSPDMQGKGYFCGKRVEVTFISGYKSSAMIADNGRELTWANGVVWSRPRTED